MSDEILNENLPEIPENFAKEYISRMKADTPDIWDRIEAGISENTIEQKPEKNGVLLHFKRYGKAYASAAAVLLCITIAVPVLRNASESKSAETSINATSDYDRYDKDIEVSETNGVELEDCAEDSLAEPEVDAGEYNGVKEDATQSEQGVAGTNSEAAGAASSDGVSELDERFSFEVIYQNFSDAKYFFTQQDGGEIVLFNIYDFYTYNEFSLMLGRYDADMRIADFEKLSDMNEMLEEGEHYTAYTFLIDGSYYIYSIK